MAARQGSVEQFVREVDRRLRVYGNSRHGNRENPLDELIFILLSAQTEAYSYQETYQALAQRFCGWVGLDNAPEEEIAAVIRRGGLSRKKAKQIRTALAKVKSDFGSLSLDPLRRLDDDAAEDYLVSLAGIGTKSAKCILMYSLGRPVFPVDTHVWRVCRRLGLTPAIPKPTPTIEKELEAKVAPDIRFSLHVNLVSHGRETCVTYWPRCHVCVLNDICPSAFKLDVVWGEWRKPRGAWAKAIAGEWRPLGRQTSGTRNGDESKPR